MAAFLFVSADTEGYIGVDLSDSMCYPISSQKIQFRCMWVDGYGYLMVNFRWDPYYIDLYPEAAWYDSCYGCYWDPYYGYICPGSAEMKNAAGDIPIPKREAPRQDSDSERSIAYLSADFSTSDCYPISAHKAEIRYMWVSGYGYLRVDFQWDPYGASLYPYAAWYE